MALDITHVQAGELITSALVNELIDEMEKLDVRITKLEAAGSTDGAVEISAIYPQPVRATEDLTIIGKNFGISVGATRVRFNGVSPKTFRNGSSDNTLICDVPDLTGLPDAGGPVELTVANARTAATTTVTVLPPLKQQVGDADIVFGGVSPDPTVPGQPADFAFTLHSDALLPAKMAITASVVGAAGAPTGWRTAVLDAAMKPISEITISRNETKPFFVRVALPANTRGTPFVLQADAVGGGLTASSGAQNLVVGVDATPDPEIPDLSPIVVTNGSIEGSKVKVGVGQIADIFVEAHFTKAPATYNVLFAPAAGTNGWSTLMVVPPPDAPRFEVATADLSEPGPPAYAREVVQVSVGPTGRGSRPGKAVLTVQRTGETKKRTYTFDLEIDPTAG